MQTASWQSEERCQHRALQISSSEDSQFLHLSNLNIQQAGERLGPGKQGAGAPGLLPITAGRLPKRPQSLSPDPTMKRAPRLSLCCPSFRHRHL